MKVLCISFWAPPVLRPQAILIGKMIPAWLRQGVRPVLLTYEESGSWDVSVPVHTVPLQRWNPVVYRIPRLNERAVRSYLEFLYKKTAGIIGQYRIDLVFSFSNPQISNTLGAMIKERKGIRFVSHFSDPFYDNPYKKIPPESAGKVLEEERRIIRASDRIVFVSDELKALVMKKYPAHDRKKSVVIPHCYDKRAYPSVRRTGKREEFIISHIGAFYRERNPELLFGALQDTMRTALAVKKRLRLKLVGGVNEYAGFSLAALKGLVKKYGLEEIAEIIPMVGFRESLRIMKDSDCLVVIDADIPASPFLPSKLIDYIGSGRRIIAITPQRSATRRVMANAGWPCFNYSQKEKLARALSRLISGKDESSFDRQYAGRFEVSRTTKELLRLFRQAAG